MSDPSKTTEGSERWEDDWQEGYDDFKAGVPYHACDYPRWSLPYINWQEGWMQAKSDKECS